MVILARECNYYPSHLKLCREYSEKKGMTKSKIRGRKAMFLERTPAGRGLTVAAPSGGFQNPPAGAWPVFFCLFHYEPARVFLAFPL